MKRFLILSGFLMGAAFLTPVAATAETHHDKIYHDKEGKDDHVFVGNEDRAYRLYLGEQHQDYRDFGRMNHTQQQQYFRWRHDHSDAVLFKVEIK